MFPGFRLLTCNRCIDVDAWNRGLALFARMLMHTNSAPFEFGVLVKIKFPSVCEQGQEILTVFVLHSRFTAYSGAFKAALLGLP